MGTVAVRQRSQFDFGEAVNGGYIPPECITGILDLCTREWLYRSEDFAYEHMFGQNFGHYPDCATIVQYPVRVCQAPQQQMHRGGGPQRVQPWLVRRPASVGLG